VADEIEYQRAAAIAMAYNKDKVVNLLEVEKHGKSRFARASPRSPSMRSSISV